MATDIILWVVFAYLVVGEPILGRHMYQRLKAGYTSRMNFYGTTALMEWGLTLAVALTFLVSGIPLRLLGLYNPNGFVLPSMIQGVVFGMAIGLLVVVIATLSGRRKTSRSPDDRPQKRLRQLQAGDFQALLPRTANERLAFAGIAITAGICEETIFRGMPVYLLNHQFPSLGPIGVMVIAGIVFGVAHSYQGWKGVLGTGFLGVLFTGIYLSTGALWIPMLFHTLIDLRALLLPVPKPTSP